MVNKTRQRRQKRRSRYEHQSTSFQENEENDSEDLQEDLERITVVQAPCQENHTFIPVQTRSRSKYNNVETTSQQNAALRVLHQNITVVQTVQTATVASDQDCETTSLITPHNAGRMNKICRFCSAKLWRDETSSLCCANGEVSLPPLQPLPDIISSLYLADDAKSKHFRKHIRAYNSLFAFASLGVNEDFLPAGVYCFRVSGSVYHAIGHIQPNSDNDRPKYAQLYIYDTEHEIQNRLHWQSNLNTDIMTTISTVMANVSPFVQFYKRAAAAIDDAGDQGKDIRMVLRADSSKDPRRYNLPTSSEVAVLLPNDPLNCSNQRDIVLYRKRDDHPNQQSVIRISETHPHFDPLHYVLFFPKGEEGWVPSIKFNGKRTGQVTPSLFYTYRLMERNNFNVILHGGRLLQQYCVDQYAKVEEQRLRYIRFHQQSLRAELYEGLVDAVFRGDSHGATVGTKIVLPSSFTGGPRNMLQLYQDAMSIVRRYGKPDIFLTMTCNPSWPEITNELHSQQTAADRPDLVARIFKIKLSALMEEIVKKHLFGNVLAYVKVIEFQKRGLPHSHILIILDRNAKPITTTDIDKLVCAEIPQNKVLRDLVSRHMMHGPCGLANPNSPCMKDGKCSKKFPKSFSESTHVNDCTYPHYQRRKDGKSVDKRGIALDNRWVVPYNPYLLSKYRAHINLEVCNSIKAVKYLYKYVYKGHDRVIVEFQGEINDEIKRFVDARYVSASESCWRLFQFDMQDRYPPIQRLALHLENQQSVTYREGHAEEAVRRPKDTTLTAWFKENVRNPQTNTLLYTDMPEHYTWDSRVCTWKKRQRNRLAIGRMYSAHPAEGERFFLRLLMQHVRGAKSFKDLRTSETGTLYPTFREAASAMGLLEDDDDEWINCMAESAFVASASQLRQLFVTILVFCNFSEPLSLWDRFQGQLAEDYSHIPNMTTAACFSKTLQDIERLLGIHNKSLSNYQLPEPTETYATTCQIWEPHEQQQLAHTRQMHLNHDQKSAFTAIMETIDLPESDRVNNVFFIDGPGGTGKTYLYNTLLAKIRGRGLSATPVASSGIASELLDGGRTAHSTFKIPIPISDNSTCNISRQSDTAKMMRSSSLIIWDEAPMMDRRVFECVSRTLCDVTGSSKPFGGKVVVLGGDFRQILPVVNKGCEADILSVTLNKSFIWNLVTVFHLTKNMRITDESDNFEHWLLRIGNGTEQIFGEIGKTSVKLPAELCLPENDPESLIDAIYDDFNLNFADEHYLSGRAILTTTHENVDKINAAVLSKLTSSSEKIYRSADSISKSDSDINLYPVEFLNELTPPGLPPHALNLKTNTAVMLLRNVNPQSGLLNGTRLLLTKLGSKVLEAKILTGSRAGDMVFIPRINLTTTSDSGLPFILNRRQFPVKLSYAMTINKSQGQTLNKVGIFLPQPVFTHGKLYVAASRVRSYSGLKFMLGQTDASSEDVPCFTDNVVYQSALIH